ncbi:winged helix-turn-helix domain-containing protein [Leptolyngbya sp. NIES-2104]|uniref:winged helix-turn-helix domain-containing protein n=1 Tax=Leptolyngbya sp. NIES-2104 TaxID=1552121 RepID=UPI0006EC4CA6|nr:winged helix-turn-helix domain-containing protein [Leptolyngbya sp. NIES-2104]GAP94250.1 mobile element protein [Leptolyngbya sp. NIES-2104]
MKKPDARLLNPTTQNYLIQQAIRLRQQGKRIIDIAAFLGVHRNTITDWWRDYQTHGEAGLEQQHRGAKYGEGRTLDQEQETQVQAKMLEHFPEELGIDSALWTRRAVQSLMEQEFGIVMPIRTVGEYLKRWGYTPQKPLKRAYEQDPKAVQ